MRALTNFEEVYAVYFDDVYRYLLSLSGSESTTEELTSETFFRAMDALDHFRGECSCSATRFLRNSDRIIEKK